MLSKKSLFADLAAFKKENALKSVPTKITRRDGTSVTVKHLGFNDMKDPDGIQDDNKNESVDVSKISSKLRGLSQFSYSYNNKLNKWEVRNDKTFHLIEFSEQRLSKIDYSEFSVSTISVYKYNEMDDKKKVYGKLLIWLRKYRPTIIIFINIEIGFLQLIMQEKWIQKMYQSTDSEMARNTKLWNCCCFSSVPIKGMSSSVLYTMDNKRKERFYLIQIHIYLGINPFIISFCNLDGNEKQSTFHLRQIFDFLNQNQIEENMLVCIGCEQIIKEINDIQFKECKFILNSQQNDNGDLYNDINCYPISNLLKSPAIKISAIECFNTNDEIDKKSMHQCNHNELSCGMFANCVYFEY